MRTTDSRHDTTADTRPHSSDRASSLDATLDALSDRRCRALLGYLADSDDAFVVPDLVARLAADDDCPNDEGESALRARLHHAILPKLDEADLLDYDADRDLVRRRCDSSFDAVRSAVEDAEDEVQMDLDRLFALLAAFRRRTAYLVLLRHGDLSLPDLADEVAVAERDCSLPEVDADDVLCVYLSLYHTHVPKLAAAGIVTYEQEDDYVTLTEAGRALESPVGTLLDAADASESKP